MADKVSMIRISATLFPLMLAASCATVPQESGPDPKIAEATAGQVAEKPRKCIPLDDARSGQVVRDAIIYQPSRKLTYIAHAPGCWTSSPDPIFVVQPTGRELCARDLIRLVDRASGIPGPVCLIQEFVPYRTPKP